MQTNNAASTIIRVTTQQPSQTIKCPSSEPKWEIDVAARHRDDLGNYIQIRCARRLFIGETNTVSVIKEFDFKRH